MQILRWERRREMLRRWTEGGKRGGDKSIESCCGLWIDNCATVLDHDGKTSRIIEFIMDTLMRKKKNEKAIDQFSFSNPFHNEYTFPKFIQTSSLHYIF